MEKEKKQFNIVYFHASTGGFSGENSNTGPVF